MRKGNVLFSAIIHTGFLVVLLLISNRQPEPEKEIKKLQVIKLVSVSAVETALREKQEPRLPEPAPPIEQVRSEPPRPQPKPEPKPEPKPAPKPEPKPEPKPKPKPKPEPKPEPKPKPKPKPEPKPKPKPKPKPEPKPEIKINFDAKNKPDPDLAAQKEEQRKRREAQEARRREQAAQRQKALNDSIQALGADLTRRTEVAAGAIEGISLENCKAMIQQAYDDAWIKPGGSMQRGAVVKVQVILALDGSIKSAKIVKPSGLVELDRSVRDAMDRVRKIGDKPPSGSSETDRTFVINFNLKDG